MQYAVVRLDTTNLNAYLVVYYLKIYITWHYSLYTVLLGIRNKILIMKSILKNILLEWNHEI